MYFAGSSVNGICQTPMLASSLLNMHVPASKPSLCSTTICTAPFILVHTYALAYSVGIPTIPEHESVSSSILLTTSICFRCSFTLSIRGRRVCYLAWTSQHQAGKLNWSYCRTLGKSVSIVGLWALYKSWSLVLDDLPDSNACSFFNRAVQQGIRWTQGSPNFSFCYLSKSYFKSRTVQVLLPIAGHSWQTSYHSFEVMVMSWFYLFNEWMTASLIPLYFLSA